MARRAGTVGAGGRACLAEGCGRRVVPGAAYCREHGRTPEAVAFRRELRGIAAYVGRADEGDPARAAAVLGRFGRRAERGEFDRVGEVRRRVAMAEEAATAEVRRRVAATHEAMVRAVVGEPDVGRMGLEVARGAREAARARSGGGQDGH